MLIIWARIFNMQRDNFCCIVKKSLSVLEGIFFYTMLPWIETEIIGLFYNAVPFVLCFYQQLVPTELPRQGLNIGKINTPPPGFFKSRRDDIYQAFQNWLCEVCNFALDKL
jgi:hypothetical protein